MRGPGSACRCGCLDPPSVMTAERYYGRGTLRDEVLNAPRANLAPAVAAGPQKVPYDVLTEPVRLGAEDPAAVPPRDFFHKSGQPLVINEHEDIKWSPAPGHFVDLSQGQLQGFRCGRPVEPILAVPAQVRSGLAVGDD